MSDLISRQDAIDALLGITAIRNTIPLDSAIFNIKKLPSAERVGHWVDYADATYANCSECGRQIDTHYERGYLNYCPNCGAHMEGAEE